MSNANPLSEHIATVRDHLREGSLTLAWFSLGSIPLVEIGARTGHAAAVIDLQHGLWDRMSAYLAVSAIREVPVLMRAAANTDLAICEALDSGAAGVIVPYVETRAEAEAAVAAARFPAGGHRSAGSVRALAEGLVECVAAKPVVGLMIESALGVENAAAIASVPEVDFVFIGPGDLALSLDSFPQVDDRHANACLAVQDACRFAGVPCGIFCMSAEDARARSGQGFAAVVPANDIGVVANGFTLPDAAVAD
ncbi:HpcH/HpaI aldolase family protein [Elongatibacter sediminis]|uniref:Aldolase/citrate lyase family protein n=1 Tax=Elongatibacter sediminis TaxID=3119006 RepID=A0AAW9RA09_9GAMM